MTVVRRSRWRQREPRWTHAVSGAILLETPVGLTITLSGPLPAATLDQSVGSGWGDIDCPHYFEARSEPDIRERLRKYAAATVLGLRVPPLPGERGTGTRSARPTQASSALARLGK